MHGLTIFSHSGVWCIGAVYICRVRHQSALHLAVILTQSVLSTLIRAEREGKSAEVQQESIARGAVRLGARFIAGLQLTAQDATPWRYAMRARACEKHKQG